MNKEPRFSIGDTVICANTNFSLIKKHIPDVIVPVADTDYTVRAVIFVPERIMDGKRIEATFGILLKEIVNPLLQPPSHPFEPNFSEDKFILKSAAVKTEESITNQINELLSQPSRPDTSTE